MRRSRLPLPVAQKIRELYATGDYTQVQLAQMFEVHQPVISRIVNGRSHTGVRAKKSPHASASRTLTPEQVQEIRGQVLVGAETQASLAARFGVSQALISAIAIGRVYTDVPLVGNEEAERTSERINAWALESKRKAGLLREAQVGRCPKCDREVALGIIREGACYYCRYETAPGLTSASDG